MTALRVAYGYTGRDMHAIHADDTRAMPTSLCGNLAIPALGDHSDYRTALTTGPKCPTCQHRSNR